MKKILALCMLMACMSTSPSASGGNFGAGFVLGDPTGFDFKLWTVPQKTAIDFALGWSNDWAYGGQRYGDAHCYDGVFYENNPGYCNDQELYWGDFHMHADYLMHNFHLIHSPEKFPVYYGGGLALDYWRDGFPGDTRPGFTQIGVRGVAGISWLPRHSPFDLFLELAPVFEMFPFPDFTMNGGFGARYWF